MFPGHAEHVLASWCAQIGVVGVFLGAYVNAHGVIEIVQYVPYIYNMLLTSIFFVTRPTLGNGPGGMSMLDLLLKEVGWTKELFIIKWFGWAHQLLQCACAISHPMRSLD